MVRSIAIILIILLQSGTIMLDLCVSVPLAYRPSLIERWAQDL